MGEGSNSPKTTTESVARPAIGMSELAGPAFKTRACRHRHNPRPETEDGRVISTTKPLQKWGDYLPKEAKAEGYALDATFRL